MVSSIGILIFLAVVLVLACGLILIWQGWRGVPAFSEPYCRRCGYDMRGLNWGSPERICPECGSDVTKPGAIRFGKYERRPKRIVAGVAVVCLGILLPIGMVMMVRPTAGRGGGPSAGKSNQTLIASLATTANQPWDWQQLESRYRSGALSQAEAAAAIEQLIVYLKANPAQQRQPLSWAQGFYTAALNGKAISSEQLRRLCDAYYGTPLKVRMRSRIRQGAELRFEREDRDPWELPGAKSIFALRGVEVDGKPVEALFEYSGGKGKHYLSGDVHSWLRGKILAELSPGKHVIQFDFDWGLLDANAKLDPSFGGRPGQIDRWPKALATRKLSDKLSIEIVPPSEPVVALVTDPNRDPSGTVSVSSIEVTRDGMRVHLKPVMKVGQLPISCGFRVYAELDGAKRDLGYYGTKEQGSYSSLGGKVDSLPADLKQVTVVLEPDAEAAEKDSDANEIWGKPIRIENVPLERYDLRGEGAAPAHK